MSGSEARGDEDACIKLAGSVGKVDVSVIVVALSDGRSFRCGFIGLLAQAAGTVIQIVQLCTDASC
jgi:hypothetical protein